MKMRKRKFSNRTSKLMLAGLLNCIFVLSAFAQDARITGTITDSETGEALIGVNIMEKGTYNGTVTDLDGNYSLMLETDNAVLSITYIGYKSQDIPVEGQTEIDIVLEPDVASLDEFVVVGYGVMKRSDLTGAVSSVDNAELSKVKTHNAVEALQAKVAGMDIRSSDGRAGANPSIQLRGSRSLSGSNSPLYIVDGVEFGGNININPNDIESMEVLKDASSTAIYGSKGANGVVLITTKQGKKGKANVSLNTFYGVTSPLGSVPVGEADYYMQMKRDLYRTTNYDPDAEVSTWDLTDAEVNELVISTGALYPEEQVGYADGLNYVWPKEELESNGTQQSYHINVSGGSEKTSYSTSIEHFIEDTYIVKDKYERYGFRSNLQSQVKDFLKVGNSVVLTHQKLTRGEGLDYGSSPLASPYGDEGELLPYPIASLPFENPYVDMNPNYRYVGEFQTRIFANLWAELLIAKGLTLRSNINADLNFRRNGTSVDTYPDLERNSSSNISLQNNYKWTWTNVLTYNKTFGENHSIMLTAATEAMQNRFEGYYMDATQLQLEHNNPHFGNWYNIGTASGDKNLSSNYVGRSMMSYIGRLHYGFKDRYLATFSVRHDGASQLAIGHEWDTFPSVALAWRVTEEEFMKDFSHILSNLKLRFGYGTSGNQSIAPYASFGGIADYNLYYDFGDTGYIGTRTGRISNEGLGWEKTTSTNIGIDFGLLRNRISGSVEIYRAETNDILQNKSLPPTSAIAFQAANVGSTLNRGVEVTLNTVNVDTKNFKWTTNFTFATNDEEITFLANGVQQDVGNGWFVGYPLSVYYDYEYIGIWQTDEAEQAAIYGAEPGDVKLRDIWNEDLNGNGVIESEAEVVNENGDVVVQNEFVLDDNDRKIIGTPRPDWYGGITSNMTIFDFDLSVLFYARVGQMIQDDVRGSWAPDGRTNSMEIDYWTPNNPTNNYPRVNPGLTQSGWSDQRTLTYTDGSFYKIKDITLGYSVPNSLLEKIKLSEARIYASAKNAIVFSDFFSKGRYDPEMQGNLGYPSPRIFLVGASITF